MKEVTGEIKLINKHIKDETAGFITWSVSSMQTVSWSMKTGCRTLCFVL